MLAACAIFQLLRNVLYQRNFSDRIGATLFAARWQRKGRRELAANLDTAKYIRPSACDRRYAGQGCATSTVDLNCGVKGSLQSVAAARSGLPCLLKNLG